MKTEFQLKKPQKEDRKRRHQYLISVLSPQPLSDLVTTSKLKRNQQSELLLSGSTVIVRSFSGASSTSCVPLLSKIHQFVFRTLVLLGSQSPNGFNLFQ